MSYYIFTQSCHRSSIKGVYCLETSPQIHIPGHRGRGGVTQPPACGPTLTWCHHSLVPERYHCPSYGSVPEWYHCPSYGSVPEWYQPAACSPPTKWHHCGPQRTANGCESMCVVVCVICVVVCYVCGSVLCVWKCVIYVVCVLCVWYVVVCVWCSVCYM